MVRPELADNADFRARFRQEVDAARRVHGLYTAQVLDADPDGDPPWLVTAFVPGLTLQEGVRRHGPLPVDNTAVPRLPAGVPKVLFAGLIGKVTGPDAPLFRSRVPLLITGAPELVASTTSPVASCSNEKVFCLFEATPVRFVANAPVKFVGGELCWYAVPVEPSVLVSICTSNAVLILVV